MYINIRHHEFMDTLINKTFIRHIMKGIKSFDDGIHTLAYGHKDIPK